MVSPLFFYQLTLSALVWLSVMLQGAWPSASVACPLLLAGVSQQGRGQRPAKGAGADTGCPHARRQGRHQG